MTDLKFALLGMLYNAAPTKPLSKIDLLNSGHDKVYNIEAALKDLITQEYLSETYGSDTVKITSAGRIAYEAAKEKREQQTQQDRIRQLEKKLNIALLLSPFIIFALDLLVEYLPVIMDWLVSLFP